MNRMVVAGNGGIGLAMVRHLLDAYLNDGVFATYRREKPVITAKNLHWVNMDASDETSVKSVFDSIDDLDWLINAAGFLHSQSKLPEKNIQQTDSAFFLETMSANTLPTLLLAKHAYPLLRKSKQPKFASLSARVGSISDNRLGGWYSYRASKAALNMIIKNLSIEWSRTLPKATVLALHPGTTDTALSEPFQRNVPKGKLFTPERVAWDLINIVESAEPSQTGLFLAYDGSVIPW
ncbi:putative C factor cell-cell signaling protein [Vibrio nigripulchritudo MADA3029]|uniref:SDR family oxidoreductase n=1 Tax=Vibrio nigripulchritudo TaxID=28173 RepID=UPI0003B22A2C|nr:SDR family oxidoreductase [Vibrio nigripulchritudo]CCN46697.1 putative C factor cell-cell signaling protein [Vibrio nigripulchritudo MADA3020]CCN54526.1 putative C factor cell-cell signaling protein [Vibrio nigripulchritudo MADA3021]CCN59556.1 putative C factor cell-cell signaling protein [Vibrio nigripulchritudo MADA3029]